MCAERKTGSVSSAQQVNTCRKQTKKHRSAQLPVVPPLSQSGIIKTVWCRGPWPAAVPSIIQLQSVSPQTCNWGRRPAAPLLLGDAPPWSALIPLQQQALCFVIISLVCVCVWQSNLHCHFTVPVEKQVVAQSYDSSIAFQLIRCLERFLDDGIFRWCRRPQMFPSFECIAEGHREQQSESCRECNAGDFRGHRAPIVAVSFVILCSAGGAGRKLRASRPRSQRWKKRHVQATAGTGPSETAGPAGVKVCWIPPILCRKTRSSPFLAPRGSGGCSGNPGISLEEPHFP